MRGGTAAAPPGASRPPRPGTALEVPRDGRGCRCLLPERGAPAAAAPWLRSPAAQRGWEAGSPVHQPSGQAEWCLGSSPGGARRFESWNGSGHGHGGRAL